MWKRSFHARVPSKSESRRCENEAFVRDIPQNLKMEDVKTKLSCESSLKIWKWKMWKWKMFKRSFRARVPSKSESWRCEKEAFVRDFPQFLKVEIVKMTPGLSVPLQGRSENDPGTAETVRGRPPDKLPHPSSGTRFVLQTRCSPRTRMLTRMLMVMIPKHMEMQSRRTLFWNSLFEESCTFFPLLLYQWTVNCGIWKKVAC